MGEDTVLEWGVHLSRHLQILIASFLECFPPDHVAELKCDYCYDGLPKWFKVMEACLKGSVMKRCIPIISKQCRRLRRKWWKHPPTHLQPVQISPGQQASFLCGSSKAASQPWPLLHGWHTWRKTMANKEECIDSEDPDGIKGVMKEFIVYLAWAVKDAQQEEKCCYHCSSLDNFICNFPLVVGSRTDSHLNQKERTAPKKGAQAPQGKETTPKVPQDGTPKA